MSSKRMKMRGRIVTVTIHNQYSPNLLTVWCKCTYTKREASYTIDTDFVKINTLSPNILINAFPKFIYSYAAASSHLTFYIFKF